MMNLDRSSTLLWHHFADLAQIPRGSGNEGGVRSYLQHYALKHAFDYREDNTGNCLVSIPGRGCGMHVPAVTIQSHMDMVCVKESDSTHDFTRDPLLLRQTSWTEKGVTQEVLMATGTTLGADNGIGLVAALAVAIDPTVIDCPPLELLFTVDEETGLTGAQFVAPELLRTDLLINLDTEELGEICISCAGGRDLIAEWTLNRTAASPGELPLRISLSGLPGGHSGVQIHEKRGNAIKMLLHELLSIPGVAGAVQLASFTGGSARNVIPSTAEIVLWASLPIISEIQVAFTDPALAARIEHAILADEAQKVVVDCEILSSTEAPQPITLQLSQSILNAIAALPNGVLAMSEVVPGLVETSNNVAVVSTSETSLRLHCSTRSSKLGAIEAFQEAVNDSLARTGAAVTHSDGYPGWPADAHNPLLVQAQQTFARVLGHAPKVMAVHAGLECGVLKGKRPTLQMISFGPDIFGAHTVNERIVLASIPPFYACLTELLSDLARL